MNGQQIVDAIHAECQQRFRDHAGSRMQCEIELLRAKVIEQAEKLEDVTGEAAKEVVGSSA